MIRLFVFILFSGLSAVLPAQNLLDDSRNLLSALRTVQDDSASNEQRDAAARQALLILFLYDEPTQITAPEHVDAGWLLDRIKSNPLLEGIVTPGQDSAMRALAPVDATKSAVWTQIQTPERTRISSLMYSGAAVSPVEFLSVQQSMRKSPLPPLQNPTAMRNAADRVQTPPSLNALNTEAVLRGLFEFILERAQQEVAISFFENLLDKKVPKVGFLFPNVRSQYNNPNITYSQSFLEGLREAFYLDLKGLSITIPELLLKDEYFGDLQQDPVFYNLLTAYTIFGLAHEAPLSEVFPVVHRDLYQRYQTAGRNLNFELANTADSTAAYKQVVSSTSEFIRQLNLIYTDLDDAETELENRISALQQSHSDAPLPPDRTRYLANPLYSYQVLIGNADTSSGFDLNLLPQLLVGSLDSATLSAYNTFESYDRFFDPPRTALNWRIAGLELTRNLGGNLYNNLGITAILQRWQSDLAAYERAVDAWQTSFDTLSVEQQILATDVQRQTLQQLIIDTRKHWLGKVDARNLQPLVVLESIAADFTEIDFGGYTKVQELRLRREKLFETEKRLKLLEQRLAIEQPLQAIGSPLQKYLLRDQDIRPSDQILGKVNRLNEQLQTLQKDLDQLDKLQAEREQNAWKNTRPMLQLTEIMSHLLYVVQTPQGLMSLKTLDSVLYEPQLRQISMGLLQQRMSRIQDVGLVSPDGIAQLTRLTLEDLLRLQTQKDTINTDAKPDSMRLFHTITVALQSLNRVLELPLFANPDKPLSYTPLVVRDTTLKWLPDISERCMNFLYYLETGENRSAISSLLRLMTTLSHQIGQRKPTAERSQLLRFFEENGDFIAGLVDARTKDQVEYLLKSLADPPGSSRTKRTHAITVGINAYVGASAGREFWERSPQNQNLTSDFTVLAPTMPVGFTVSGLLGASSKKHPQSFSLHVSLLDLGAMMTYRLESEGEFGAYKLTYKNVFKPGLQLHWNIQRSPFYLGVGWQTGAQFRVVDDKEISFRSSRTFLAFGIDVPIKTLYQR